MKKTAIVAALFCLAHTNDFSDNALKEIVDQYRNSGLQQVETSIQTLLEKKDYWLLALQNQDVSYGYYESYRYLFVSNKAIPNLTLYQINNGQLTQLGISSALVGSGKGNKKVSGDLTTPIGVYDILNKLKKLDQYYGPMAFVTSYPNVYDKSLKKTGYGIWIHGMPLNGNRDELNTKGCIAIENDVISKYDKQINFKDTLLIAYENHFQIATKDEIASILANLFQWKEAWQKGDFEKYISFYSPDFRRTDGTRYDRYKSYKKRIFEKKEVKQINFSQINITPYPNEEGKRLFRISFDQEYAAFNGEKLTYRSNGKKELYVVLNGKEKFLILLEE